MAFIDQGEFEAMKTLSSWKAVRCDEHPFRAKIEVSAWTVFELSLFDKVVSCGLKEERKKERIDLMQLRHVLCGSR